MSLLPPRFGSIHLRLLQPEPHVHLAVHRGCGGEVLLRLLALARAPIELAKAEVAVGDERTHGESFGQSDCLPVQFVGLFRIGWHVTPNDLGEDTKGLGLDCALMLVAGGDKRALGSFSRLVRSTGTLVALREPRQAAWQTPDEAC